MAISRDELKKKRLRAAGVVGEQMQATADMYDRVTAAGDKVAKAREAAEAAHLADLDGQVADLKEMAGELEEFGQTVPLPSGEPAKTTVTPFAGSALAALNSAQPKPEKWDDGSAYHGTAPPKL